MSEQSDACARDTLPCDPPEHSDTLPGVGGDLRSSGERRWVILHLTAGACAAMSLPMRLLVCGSRVWPGTWEDIGEQWPDDHPDLTIIHGGCSRIVRGARVSVDMLTDFVARWLGYAVESYPVDHAKDGEWPGAGPRRNARMLADSKPTHGLAFGALWRSTSRVTGTGDMVRRMLGAGLPVRWVAAPGVAAVDLTVMPKKEPNR